MMRFVRLSVCLSRSLGGGGGMAVSDAFDRLSAARYARIQMLSAGGWRIVSL